MIGDLTANKWTLGEIGNRHSRCISIATAIVTNRDISFLFLDTDTLRDTRRRIRNKLTQRHVTRDTRSL